MINKCDLCLFDEQNCEDCKYPEFTDDAYRDNCDVCCDLIMIPYNIRDIFNLVICKKCAKIPAQEIYDEYCDSANGADAIGTFEGVYIEGTRKWW